MSGKKYVSILETLRYIEIHLFKNTPYPDVLENIISKNKEAIKKLDRLMSSLKKMKNLGINVFTDISVKYDDMIYIDVERNYASMPKIIVEISEKHELYNKYRKTRTEKIEDAITILKEIRKVAEEETNKSERLLKQLIEEGLVEEVEVKEETEDEEEWEEDY